MFVIAFLASLGVCLAWWVRKQQERAALFRQNWAELLALKSQHSAVIPVERGPLALPMEQVSCETHGLKVRATPERIEVLSADPSLQTITLSPTNRLLGRIGGWLLNASDRLGSAMLIFFLALYMFIMVGFGWYSVTSASWSLKSIVMGLGAGALGGLLSVWGVDQALSLRNIRQMRLPPLAPGQSNVATGDSSLDDLLEIYASEGRAMAVLTSEAREKLRTLAEGYRFVLVAGQWTLIPASTKGAVAYRDTNPDGEGEDPSFANKEKAAQVWALVSSLSTLLSLAEEDIPKKLSDIALYDTALDDRPKVLTLLATSYPEEALTQETLKQAIQDPDQAVKQTAYSLLHGADFIQGGQLSIGEEDASGQLSLSHEEAGQLSITQENDPTNHDR